MESYTGPSYLSRMSASVNSFLQDIMSNDHVPQSGESKLFSEEPNDTDLAFCIIFTRIHFVF